MRGKAQTIRRLNDAHAKVYDVIANLQFYREHLDQVMVELGLERSKLYLDLGCGTGNLLSAARGIGISLIGVDFSQEMLRRAKKRGKDIVMADLHYLPFRDGCIDGVASVNVFYQLDRPEMFLREVHRVLKPGGRVVISTPRRGKSPWRFDLELIKTAMRDPKVFADLRGLVAYSMINKRIIDLNPDAFYSREELEAMFGNFEVQSIKKAYKGQNWLVVARKPIK